MFFSSCARSTGPNPNFSRFLRSDSTNGDERGISGSQPSQADRPHILTAGHGARDRRGDCLDRSPHRVRVEMCVPRRRGGLRVAKQLADDRQAHGRGRPERGERMPKVVNADAFKARSFGDSGPRLLKVGSRIAFYAAGKDVRISRDARQARKDFQGRGRKVNRLSCRSCWRARGSRRAQNRLAPTWREGFRASARRSGSKGGSPLSYAGPECGGGSIPSARAWRSALFHRSSTAGRFRPDEERRQGGPVPPYLGSVRAGSRDIVRSGRRDCAFQGQGLAAPPN